MRTVMTSLGCWLVLTLAAAPPAMAEGEGFKVGVFDPQRVFEGTALGQRVQAELSGFKERKQAEIAEKEKLLADQQQQLRSQELSLSPDRRATIEREVQRLVLDLQSSREAAVRALQLESSSAQAGFEDKLLTTVRELGRSEGFSIILDSSVVAWAESSVDLTTSVIDRFNTLFPVESGEPKPPTPPAEGR
jgi:Skp family chaperone for outer membrane proteins